MSAGFDLIVIGGGIHGAGVAQAGAAAGHSVLLLEQYPTFAQGTSSRSSKLIHGGLRYLETGQFGLVRESLHERALLLELAPELVRMVDFHIPVYADSLRPAWKVRAGLSLYAGLAGFGRRARFGTVPRREWDDLDGLVTDGLRAVFRYGDAQTDDAALTRAVIASARELGAEVLKSARAESVVLDGTGAAVRYAVDGTPREARAAAVVNAGGPWANRVLDAVTPRQEPVPVDLVQGAHLVLPGQLERGIYYVEAADGRVIFAMPWRENVMIGTTETAWHDDPAASYPMDDEIAYLLASYGRLFPRLRHAKDDVIAAFAGLRVLPAGGGDAFGRPRDVILRTDAGNPPRLVSLFGGKLTTYRATAAKALERLGAALPARRRAADTARLPLRPVA